MKLNENFFFVATLALIGAILLRQAGPSLFPGPGSPTLIAPVHAAALDPGPTRFCPLCEATGRAYPIWESADPSRVMFHNGGFAWIRPSAYVARAPGFILAPVQCPLCHGRGLIGR